MNTPGAVLLAPSTNWGKYDSMYYLKGAAAGGICCSITHGALTPVDVVKTRVQLDPAKVCDECDLPMRNFIQRVDVLPHGHHNHEVDELILSPNKMVGDVYSKR